MSEEEKKPEQPTQLINTVIPQLMEKVGAIGKDRQSGKGDDKFKFNFRGIDDVLNHVGPAAAELGLRVEVEVSEQKEEIERYEEYNKQRFRVFASLKMTIRFIAADCSCHTVSAYGSSIDTMGDKAMNKAMSYAFKYCCTLGLVIPVAGALDEGDKDTKQPEINSDGYQCDDLWYDWEVPFGSPRVKGRTLGDLVASGEAETLRSISDWIKDKMQEADKEKNKQKFNYYMEMKGRLNSAIASLNEQSQKERQAEETAAKDAKAKQDAASATDEDVPF